MEMWNRKELKRQGRSAFFRNFWACVAVCFLIAFLVGEYGTSTSAIHEYTEEFARTTNAVHQMISNSNGNILGDFLASLTKSALSRNTNSQFIVDIAVNSKTSTNDNFTFHLLDGISTIVFDRDIAAGVILIVSSLIAIAYTVFVANILVIGSKRFYLENRRYPGTRASRFLYLFRMRKIIHPASIMFFRWLYNLLWSFTIIGGIIKFYEYRLIPYILAENPELNRHKAFQLSKEMMKGNKWKTFLLDCTFLGWDLLTILTLGLLGFLYVNPYKAATDAELYMLLRNQAIIDQVDDYQELKDEYL